MDKFWELMEQSVIFQGIITLSFVITACYMMASGIEVPDLLQAGLMLILGWYFGAKTQLVASVAARKRKNGSSSSDFIGPDSDRTV
jgi:hypothetical protein